MKDKARPHHPAVSHVQSHHLIELMSTASLLEFQQMDTQVLSFMSFRDLRGESQEASVRLRGSDYCL